VHAPLRSLLTVATALLLTCTGAAVTAPTASATVTRLCVTYSGCADAGMSSAGYAKASRVMYWRMYSGHNCTNYVAYRLIRNGMPNERPWDGSGNATNWGVAMSRITDSTPTVGSVAWWRAGVYPAGSSGHVAYVERVVSPNEIIVSQDSWGGEFSWARITRDSKGWPSGFIHFNDKTLTNTALPRLTGAARVGATLTATPGTWAPSDVRTTYQWTVAGRPVSGATTSTYKVRPTDEGRRIRLTVTATKAGYPTTSVRSRRTKFVAEAALTPLTKPTVTGDPVVGAILTADPGTWDPAPSSVAYQWLVDGNPVAGADDITFTPAPEHLGSAVSVQVTASHAGYDPVTTTSTSMPVGPGTLTVTAPPALTDTDGDGHATLGETLTVAPGAVAGASAPTVAWLRSGRPVVGATGTQYTLTAADLGHPVTARLRWSRPGYVEVTTEASTGRPVKTVPLVRVRTRPGTGRLVVTATVSADGVSGLPGRVKVVQAGHVLARTKAASGTVRLKLTGLAAGTRTYRVVYTGGREVRRTAVRRTLTID
jgi:surface antigen